LEELAYLKPHTTGKMAINRWATSHLLQSYQLKEVTRLRRALKKRPTSSSTAKDLKVALEVARAHSRHETAMAVLLSCDGDSMLELMEAKKTGDKFYEKRREKLKKELKKTRIDAAILKGGVAAAIVTPAAAPKQGGGGGGGRGGSGGGGGGGGGGGSGNAPKGRAREGRARGGSKHKKGKGKGDYKKEGGGDSKEVTCFSCSAVGHTVRDCPRK
jgi:uncharacterized membrane protein YgcG